jgi:glutamyl-tRNA(Gln) amidotransferase subunit E
MDYKALGLVAGIEIHQQLDTKEKLFCHCPTTLREIAEHNGEFSRYLRATVSEMGEIDRAAKEEMKHDRMFRYYTYDTTCLVENDEEPPAPVNDEALSVCLTIGKMFGMTPVPQVHTMRKLVIDGSNTSGFQRTALVAFNGALPNGGLIETICLEEEAAQRVKDEVFSLDRLGIPLVEITTSPCMHSPDEVQSVAEYIGMVLRSTGKVKRGLGTIRQDVNISIAAGARVEIKGVQDLGLISEVVRREVQRQQNLLAIRDELVRRGATIDTTAGVDVTALFKETKSTVLKKAKKIHAIVLKGFAGLVGREIQPERRLGSEMSDYAKKCGVGGIFHTDELPAYGVTAEEVATLRSHLHAAEQDCVIIASGTSEKQASCAISQVITRAKLALSDKPVPEETRKMLESGSTSYMRPLPGAARMYPETDVLPVLIDEARWDAVVIPELLTAKADRFVAAYEIERNYALQLAASDKLPLFEQAVAEGIKPKLAVFTILSTTTELRRDGVDIAKIPDQAYLDTWHAVDSGKAAREAIPDIFRSIAEGSTFAEALAKLAPAVSREELEKIVKKIIAERADFVQQKGMAALGPLMGVVMGEVRGSVDGKVVSQILKTEIGAATTPKKP